MSNHWQGYRPGQPQDRKALTYRQLKEALAELTDEQLDQGVVVSAGCDENGEAEFFSVDSLTLAMNPDVEAAAIDLFEPIQPIVLFADGSLLCTEDFPDPDDNCTGSYP